MIQERLGFGPEERLLIIHVDDIGCCHSSNKASLEVMTRGIATSGSLMMPCSWVPEVAAEFAANPELDLGVHAVFTSERLTQRWGPCAPRDKVAGLLDAQGYFCVSSEEVCEKATALEYETELRAQVEMALQLGFKPTHIDSHMFTLFLREDFFDIYLRVGREYGLPPLIFPQDDPEMSRSPVRNVDRLRGEGFILIDHMLMQYSSGGGGDPFETRREAYLNAIRKCVPGLNFMILHATLNDEESMAFMGPKPVNNRVNDHRVFTGEGMREAIEEMGVRLIGWRPLQEIFQESC